MWLLGDHWNLSGSAEQLSLPHLQVSERIRVGSTLLCSKTQRGPVTSLQLIPAYLSSCTIYQVFPKCSTKYCLYLTDWKKGKIQFPRKKNKIRKNKWELGVRLLSVLVITGTILAVSQLIACLASCLTSYFANWQRAAPLGWRGGWLVKQQIQMGPFKQKKKTPPLMIKITGSEIKRALGMCQYVCTCKWVISDLLSRDETTHQSWVLHKGWILSKACSVTKLVCSNSRYLHLKTHVTFHKPKKKKKKKPSWTLNFHKHSRWIPSRLGRKQ